MAVPTGDVVTAAAPETLTFQQALATAAAFRDELAQRQAETEERTYPAEDVHVRFVEAGFYHMLRPKTFGGYEFDVPSFLRVFQEIARGCMSTAWCCCLASGHNLQVASWFPESTQREVFVEGTHFAAPMTAAPGGVIQRTDGGWLLSSRQPYASGAPYSTHFVGHAFLERPGAPMSTFIAQRSDWTMLDDWGRTLGLKGSGSHTLVFEDVTLPEDWVLEGRVQTDMDVGDGTPGLALHGNPMYGGRALGFFASELAALTIGGAWAALDEYEVLMVNKKTLRPPPVLRTQDPDFQAWFGQATAGLHAAEGMLYRAAEMFMQCCERAATGGEPFSHQDDVMINLIAREAMTKAWKVTEDIVIATAGSSAATNGHRLERQWRDLTMAWGHVNTSLRNYVARDFTRAYFDVPTPA